jgi:hypothetical protein
MGTMSEHGLSRRLALQSLAASLGGAGAVWLDSAQATAHPVARHLQREAERPQMGGDARPRLLDEHQFKTLSAFAEIVVPGSRATASDVFIDMLLAVDDINAKRRFLSALGAIDGAALAAHRKAFVDLTVKEQETMLTAISEQPASDPLPAAAGQGHGDAAEASVTLRDHFDHLKGWVAGAYYSSEVGMRELGWTEAMFFSGFPACSHPEGHR